MTVALLREAHTSGDSPLPGMVGTHPLMGDVYRLVREAAGTDLPVAVIGETGVGKELVARALHDLSPRQRGPFVAVNAAALPETLFESELFGHERGAFSDARTPKPGLLEVAHCGTFFCDEIATLSPAVQAKLLRVIEEGVSRRVGGLDVRPAAPRWVASCQHYDVVAGMARGLREDLWYRLSAVVVVIPPLRQRRSDIPALARHFLSTSHVDPDRLDPGALEVLIEAGWRGNVRELKQVVCRMALGLNGCRITATTVRGALHGPGDLGRAAGTEPELLAALQANEWNLQRAARALGVARGTLYRRMRAAGLERPAKLSHCSWNVP